MIWGFVGPEGGGKSTAMTYHALLHKAKGGRVCTFPGYDIYDGLKTDSKGNRIKLSSPIDIQKFITMSYELKDTLICIDEIQNFMDSSKHMTLINQLMGYVGMQRRKMNLGIFYTVQNWMWLYNRMRWLTHLLTYCFDLRWSPWGRENGIKRGEMVRLTTFDCKGFITGKPWQPLQPKLLRATKIHDCFESYAVIDIFEGFRKIEVKRPIDVIDLRPPEEIARELDRETRSAILAGDQVENEELLSALAAQGVKVGTLAKVAKKLAVETANSAGRRQ